MSLTEGVERSLESAEKAQGTINAFTHIDAEGARARAASLEGASGEGPLHGVPIALKDLIDDAGQTTTCGSAFYRHRAEATAPCVARLKAAGAVIVGRAGLHEWAFGFSSENPHWGAVRNPVDTDTSAGGSSGGSAAAVAAGITPIAIGTDTGGSVRVPAALCGTYGLKVTHGRIPLDGVFPLVPSIDTVGPLANSVDNLETAYRVMSGDDAAAAAPVRLRFGIPQPWFDDAPCEERVAAEFSNFTESLRSAGHEVHPISLPEVGPSRQIINAIAREVRAVHRPFRERHETYGEDVASRLAEAEAVTDEEADDALGWQQMLRDRFADAFETVDFMITPTVPVMRKVIGVDTIGDRHYRAVLSYFSSLVNHTLHPAIACPMTGSGEPPVSIQLIGPLGSELAMLGIARALETENLLSFRVFRPNSPTAHLG